MLNFIKIVLELKDMTAPSEGQEIVVNTNIYESQNGLYFILLDHVRSFSKLYLNRVLPSQ